MISLRSTLAALAVLTGASCGATPAYDAPDSATPPPASSGGGERGAAIDRPYIYEVIDEERSQVAPDTLSTLQVSGTGRVEVEADEGVVTFAVETEAESAETASQQNAQRMSAVLAALRGADVPGLEIETRGYSLQPRYRRPDASGTREIDGYRASNAIEVTVPDVAAVGEVIDTAIGAGANRVASLAFQASDADEARLEAVRDAVARARREAEAMAAAVGASLGPVLEITGGADPVAPLPMYRAEAMMMQDAATPVEPGTQTVSASVTIRYRLEGTGP